MINFTNYLHERAEESRHNESISLLIAVLGAVLLVGGVSLTLATTNNTQWWFIFPYQLSEASGVLGMTLTVIGLPLLIFGIGLAIRFSSQREWYFDELKKTYHEEEDKLKSLYKKKIVSAKKLKT